MASLLKEGEAVLADRQHAEVADQALVRLHTRNGPYSLQERPLTARYPPCTSKAMADPPPSSSALLLGGSGPPTLGSGPPPSACGGAGISVQSTRGDIQTAAGRR